MRWEQITRSVDLTDIAAVGNEEEAKRRLVETMLVEPQCCGAVLLHQRPNSPLALHSAPVFDASFRTISGPPDLALHSDYHRSKQKEVTDIPTANCS